MEWSKEAQEFVESRRAKLSGKAAEIDSAIERIRKDSEKAASHAGATVVDKEHVKLAITGLAKIEVVTEATEGSFAFVRALVILGAIMLFVGVTMEAWYANQRKYGDEPTEDVDIFILRWMLPVGIIMLAVAGILFFWGRRRKGEEFVEGQPGVEAKEGAEQAPAPSEGEKEQASQ